MFDEPHASPGKSEITDPTSQEDEQQQLLLQNQLPEPAEVLETCAGCQTVIADKYLLRIRSLAWHEQCATCCACNCQLTEGCFVKDNRLYCAHDYAKRHGIRCQSCCHPIATQDLAMWAHSYAYHLACFVCAACGAQLRKGDQFAVRPTDGRPVCLCDAASVTGGGDCSGGSSSSVVNFCPEDRRLTPLTGGVGPSSLDAAADANSAANQRRARTVLTAAQRRRFRVAFEQNQRPTRRICEALANEAGLAVRVVQVWFQNQRAQLKKRSSSRIAANSVAAAAAASSGGASSSRQLRSRLRGVGQQQTRRQSSDAADENDEDFDNDEELEYDDEEDEEDLGPEEEDDLDGDGMAAEPDDQEGEEDDEDEAELGNLMIIPPLETSPQY